MKADNVRRCLRRVSPLALWLLPGAFAMPPVVPSSFAAVPQAPGTERGATASAHASGVPESTWTTTLPGKVQVRLVGITAGPSAVGPWWSPEGVLLPVSPYPEETAAERTLRPSDYALYGGKPGERPYYFAWEITQPTAADVQPINANLLDPLVDGRLTRTRVRCLIFLPPSKHIGAAALALASGPWETIVRASTAGGHFAGKDRQGVPYDFQLQAHLLPLRVDSLPSGSVIRIEWTGHFGGANPWQINVIDRRGQPMEQVIGGEVAATRSYHIEFRPHGSDSPTLEQVREIRVQVRPQQEVVFPNVVLQPIIKKDAK